MKQGVNLSSFVLLWFLDEASHKHSRDISYIAQKKMKASGSGDKTGKEEVNKACDIFFCMNHSNFSSIIFLIQFDRIMDDVMEFFLIVGDLERCLETLEYNERRSFELSKPKSNIHSILTTRVETFLNR